MLKLNLDCVYYKGEKPCIKKRLCEGCEEYLPMGKRILILKHAAMGDVLRTTPLLYAVKRKHPDAYITWMTDPASADLLKYNPMIDRLFIYGPADITRVLSESFDLILSLDKEPRTAALAMQVGAKEKRGIGLSPEGSVYPLNREADHYFKLGISDHLKFFENKRSYQDLVCEAVDFPYQQDPYCLKIPDSARENSGKILQKLGIDEKDRVIGFNTGAGGVFANKNWTPGHYVALINQLNREFNFKILLLGGDREKELNNYIQTHAEGKIANTGSQSLLDFCGIIERCHFILTGDTLGMHLAIGLKVKLLVLFGPTCSQEIDLYGLGEKIVSTIPCAPCYKQICPETVTCMDLISVEKVFRAMQSILGGSFFESARKS